MDQTLEERHKGALLSVMQRVAHAKGQLEGVRLAIHAEIGDSLSHETSERLMRAQHAETHIERALEFLRAAYEVEADG